MSCLRQGTDLLSHQKPSREFSTVWLRLGAQTERESRLRYARMLITWVRTALEAGVRRRRSSHTACIEVRELLAIPWDGNENEDTGASGDHGGSQRWRRKDASDEIAMAKSRNAGVLISIDFRGYVLYVLFAKICLPVKG